jgi:hypothetical protein
MKMNLNEILTTVITSKLIDEVFVIVIEEYPEIIYRAWKNLIDKNPETFKEIFEEMRLKNNAKVQ